MQSSCHNLIMIDVVFMSCTSISFPCNVNGNKDNEISYFA